MTHPRRRLSMRNGWYRPSKPPALQVLLEKNGRTEQNSKFPQQPMENWICIAYSQMKDMIFLQILATPLIHFLFQRLGRMYFLSSGVKGLRVHSGYRPCDIKNRCIARTFPHPALVETRGNTVKSTRRRNFHRTSYIIMLASQSIIRAWIFVSPYLSVN